MAWIKFTRFRWGSDGDNLITEPLWGVTDEATDEPGNYFFPLAGGGDDTELREMDAWRNSEEGSLSYNELCDTWEIFDEPPDEFFAAQALEALLN